MRIVNAVWEKKNLGIDVIEVNCSEKDTIEDLTSTLNGIDVPYSVVKIPSGCINHLMAAQKLGYVFIETSYNYECNIRKFETPEIYSRFLNKVKVKPASEDLKSKALKEIKAGAIFSTDRIAIDPHFSKELAGNRYFNWCNYALSNGAIMEVSFFNDEPIAFNLSETMKERKGVVHGLLGGVFESVLDKGLGFLVVESEVECCRMLGGKICAGSTSSNNLPSLRLHMRYGFDIIESCYVLIKHK